MRLKRLLVVLLTTVMCSLMAAAAGSQLTNVSVVAQGNSTTVTMHATGTFGHNEYRANDSLLLVDLTGVSAGKLHERERAFQVPGVRSYRVVGYKGMGGVDVARLELRIAPGADINVNQAPGGLAVTITPKEGEPAAVPVDPAAQAKAPAAALTVAANPASVPNAVAKTSATVPASQHPAGVALVNTVSVARGADGMEIAIIANAGIQGKVMKLASPHRLVVDIANSIPAARPKPIHVNSGGVKGVRMAQFSAAPPVTRVVVDLDAAYDYDLNAADNKLVLKLHPAASVAGAAKPVVAAAVSKPDMASSQASTDKPAVQQASAKAEMKTEAARLPETLPAVVAAPAKKRAEVKTAVFDSASQSTIKPIASPVETKTADAEVARTQPPASELTPAAAKADPEPFATARQAEKISKGDSEPAPSAQPVVFVEPSYQAKADAPQNAAPAPVQTASIMQQPAAPLPAPQQPAVKAAPDKSVNFAQEQRGAQPGELVQKPRYTGEPISVNLKDVDLKDFFRLIHEISGMNVVLDPSVQGTLTLVLDDVPWDQALDIVLKNNGLDRQLDGNVLRIATVDNIRKEAQAHRLQVEAQALAVDKINVTRFLSYAHAKDVMPTVKKLLSQRGDIVVDERTNALIIQDIPAVVPEIDRLLAQLDRKTQEVEIEARVVAATRQFARDIGTQIGFGFGNASTAIGGAPQAGTGSITQSYLFPPPYVTSPGVSPPQAGQAPKAQAAAVPLFSNLLPEQPTSGLSLTSIAGAYRIDAVLAAAESRGLLKILSRPRVVTQNNIQAIVKQGFRIPVVTLGQLGGPPSVTYIEAVLRLTVTPQITVENTIFLNVDIENTTPDFSQQVLGNPVFLTQQATTQVLVTDGGTVLVGGVIQTQNSVNVSQVPLLGDVPVLGNLFKHRQVKNTTQELIFIITPKIIQT